MLINKNKKAVLSLILSLIIPLSSCGAKGNDNYQESPSSIIESTQDDIEFGLEYQEKEQKKFALSCFKNYLDSIYIEYPFEDYYLSDEDIDNIIASSNTKTTCLNTYNKDVSSIIERIRKNSEKYLENHYFYYSAFLTQRGGYEDNIAFERALTECLSIMLKGTNDLNEDIHRMQTLSICFGDGSRALDDGSLKSIVVNDESGYYILGYYDPRENLMVIDPIIIKAISYTKPNREGHDNFYEVMLSTVMHEFNHVRQSVCDCRIEQNEDLLASVKYDEEYSSALTESSAESELYNMDKFPYDCYRSSYDYTYTEERNQEAIVFLLALFNEHANVDDYYNGVFDTDYQSIHNFLTLTSREDVRRFYYALYSMDAISLRNDLVLKVYSEEERDAKTLLDLRDDLGYDYLIEIYRFVLDRMSIYTYNHEDFSLEDNLVVLSVIQDIICDKYFTAKNDGSISYQRFRDNLLNMDDAYKEFLCDMYSVDREYIKKQGDKILSYEMCLTDTANGENTFLKEYSIKSKKLLERLPILKPILRNRELFLSSYETVLVGEELTLHYNK